VFKRIKLRCIGYVHKVSPEFTHKPSYEAVVKDEFTDKLHEEEEDPDIEVPEIELIPKIVWAKCPKTKRRSGPNYCICGGGSVRNGECKDPSECCSPFGWCGTEVEYCEVV
jgi:hypothetical protein